MSIFGKLFDAGVILYPFMAMPGDRMTIDGSYRTVIRRMIFDRPEDVLDFVIGHGASKLRRGAAQYTNGHAYV